MAPDPPARHLSDLVLAPGRDLVAGHRVNLHGVVVGVAGNDFFARFAQLPPLVLLFFLVVRLCREAGCGRTVAGLVGVAAALSRPFFSEACIAKDDVYVAAFFAAAVLALSRGPARDRLGPARVGVAVGFVLASKYTALLSCPVLLFMADAPFRARWRPRHWVIAAGVAGAMALPWYVRNALLTGNPLYPLEVHLPGLQLHGLFTTEHDSQLRTAGGAWKMLTEAYHGLPAPLLALLLGGWAWAWSAGRSVLRDPLTRAAVIGLAVTLVLYLAASRTTRCGTSSRCSRCGSSRAAWGWGAAPSGRRPSARPRSLPWPPRRRRLTQRWPAPSPSSPAARCWSWPSARARCSSSRACCTCAATNWRC